jgi:hypothetical protein
MFTSLAIDFMLVLPGLSAINLNFLSAKYVSLVHDSWTRFVLTISRVLIPIFKPGYVNTKNGAENESYFVLIPRVRVSAIGTTRIQLNIALPRKKSFQQSSMPRLYKG